MMNKKLNEESSSNPEKSGEKSISKNNLKNDSESKDDSKNLALNKQENSGDIFLNPDQRLFLNLTDPDRLKKMEEEGAEEIEEDGDGNGNIQDVLNKNLGNQYIEDFESNEIGRASCRERV